MSLKRSYPRQSANARRGYRIHPSSFVLSILFHAVVVAGLLLIPLVSPEEQAYKQADL